MKLIIVLIFVLLNFLNRAFGQAASDSLLRELLSGNDYVDLVVDIYRENGSLSTDSLNQLLNLSNKNYLQKDLKRKEKPDLQLRQILFSDQLYRTNCYNFKLIDYQTVQKNDSILQFSFLKIIEEYPKLDPLTNSAHQMTFYVLLLHSITNVNADFFANNYSKYSAAFNNNLKEFQTLRTLIDLYLKMKYEKQYFGTDFGKGKLTNGSFGLLPKLSEPELKKILLDLKVSNATY